MSGDRLPPATGKRRFGDGNAGLAAGGPHAARPAMRRARRYADPYRAAPPGTATAPPQVNPEPAVQA